MRRTWSVFGTFPRSRNWELTRTQRWPLTASGCVASHSCFLRGHANVDRQGAFDSFEHENLPRTKYDQIIDETSNKPGEQAFEKLISGRYLGEILRLIICELIDEGVLFLGQNTYKIEIPYSLDTAFLSLMESDPTDELLMIIGIFSHFFALETTLAERQFFRALAKLVARRAARLSACGIAAIVSKMGYLEEGCAVGADGSLYNVRLSCVMVFPPALASGMCADIPGDITEIPKVCGPDTRGAAGHLWREGKVSDRCDVL